MSSGQGDDDKGVGSSSGLSLREKLRLKAQQKIQAKQVSPPLEISATTKSLLATVKDESDDEELGSLTLGRTQRQAALKRPASYSIDPIDDASRLRRHPNSLSTAATSLATSSASKPRSIESMLRERDRKVQRGTDAAGFSRAEEIARSMEQERLEALGISTSSKRGSSKRSSNGKVRSPSTGQHGSKNRNGDEKGLTVKALSPNIPSFIWSSQSEGGDTDEEAETKLNDSRDVDMAASLAAMGVDEETKQKTLDILQQKERTRKSEGSSKGAIPFWRSGRTSKPSLDEFGAAFPLSPEGQAGTPTKPVAPASSSADVGTSTKSRIVREQPVLYAGVVPKSLNLSDDQLERMIVWTSISYVFERSALTGYRRLSLFRSLILPAEESPLHAHFNAVIPRALERILALIPRILARIGVSKDVLEECFPDHAAAINIDCPLIKRRNADSFPPKASGSAASDKASSENASDVYLTQAECNDIVTNLARIVEVVIPRASKTSSHFVVKHLSLLVGYLSSMALGNATSMNFNLQAQVGSSARAILIAAKRENEQTLRQLQKETVDRTLSALGDVVLGVHARLVDVWPGGEFRQSTEMKRWISWLALTKHLPLEANGDDANGREESQASVVVPSSDPYEAVVDQEEARAGIAWYRRSSFVHVNLDLDLVAKAIDNRDVRSPFYVAPPNASYGDDSERQETDFESMIAATSLLGVLLTEFAMHIFVFSPDSPPNASAGVLRPKSTRLALASYMVYNPTLSVQKITTLRMIIDKLAHVNSRIRDNMGDVIFRSLAKEGLQRWGLFFEYQLEFYDPTGSSTANGPAGFLNP